MDFGNYLIESAAELNQEIRKLLNNWRREAENTSKSLVPFAKSFIASCSGGKRIRGTLVKLGFELTGKKSSEIVRIGAAYEILHAAILIHDDIMDQSELRRGQPSLYKKLGIPCAIALGDLGFFLAIKIISESAFPEIHKNNALKLFSKTLVDTAIGQILDLEKADLILTAKLKTACYTISGPLQLGAILGGLGPTSPRLRGIKEFGENLGIVFQIQDDILDGESGDWAKQAALKYVMRGKKLIPKITDNQKMRKLLEELAEYMVERKK